MRRYCTFCVHYPGCTLSEVFALKCCTRYSDCPPLLIGALRSRLGAQEEGLAHLVRATGDSEPRVQRKALQVCIFQNVGQHSRLYHTLSNVTSQGGSSSTLFLCGVKYL